VIELGSVGLLSVCVSFGRAESARRWEAFRGKVGVILPEGLFFLAFPEIVSFMSLRSRCTPTFRYFTVHGYLLSSFLDGVPL